MAALLYMFLLLALTGHSSATYCVCKDGVGEQALQKALDYACGAGADCNPINSNGVCYQPNTVKDHCSYAVNSYFQRKGQTAQSCDFSGAATQSTTPPTTSGSTCVYPSSSSTTNSTTPPTSTTPSTGTTPTTTPSTGTTPTTTPSTGTTPTTTPGTSTTPTGFTPPSSVFGISPTGTTGITDGASIKGTSCLLSLALCFAVFLLQ